LYAKVDALKKRFRTILSKIDEVRCARLRVSRVLVLNSAQAKRKMGRIMQLAAFSLAEVQYSAGDISYQIQEAARQATFRVDTKQENVSGVVLPTFEAKRLKPSDVGGDSSGGASPSASPSLPVSWRSQTSI
jgi:V-type H+-transporting ATPase subunit D